MLFSLVGFCAAIGVARAASATFNYTDLRVTYDGTWRESTACTPALTDGCWNIQNDCTNEFFFSAGIGESASIKFTGSAISVQLLNGNVAPIVDFSLDGKVLDTIDLYTDSEVLNCVPAITKDGLDPTKEHTLVINATALSTKSTQGATLLMLDKFTITVPGDAVPSPFLPIVPPSGAIASRTVPSMALALVIGSVITSYM